MEKPAKRILVVHEEPFAGELLKNIIADFGYEAELASSVEGALAWLEFPFHAVVIELCNPGIKADELAQSIKALHPGLPVIALAAIPPKEAPPAVDVILKKPCRLEDLREAIARIVGAS